MTIDEKLLQECRDINSGAVWIGASRGTDIPPEVSFKAAIEYCWRHAVDEERKRCLKAVADEPELSDDPPKELRAAWDSGAIDFDAFCESSRITVRLTKEGIKERIEINGNL